VPGGRCLVAWSKVARPVELGGLGVLDLTTFGYGLRMRWEWLARTEPDRMWACIPNKSERIVCAMFDVSTTVVVGSGTKTLFWENRWVDGLSITSRAPLLVQAVNKKVQKSRLVSEAMADDRWIADISLLALHHCPEAIRRALGSATVRSPR
jgi:hypothetical protein